MGLSNTAIGFGMIMIFGLAIVSFAIGFGTDNPTGTGVDKDTDYGNLRNSISGDVQSFENEVGASTGALANSTIKSGDTATETGQQFKVSVGSSLNTTKSIFRTSYSKVFGSDTGFGYVLTVVIGLIVLIVGFQILSAWRGGNI